jgi:hypothetical protein
MLSALHLVPNFITQVKGLVKATKYEALHFDVCSIFLLHLLSWTHLFFSGPFSKNIPNQYSSFRARDQYYTHAILQVKLEVNVINI